MMRRFVRPFLRAIGHSAPVASGLGMYSDAALCRWCVEGLEDSAEARLRSGLRLVVDPSEYLGRTVYLTGDWDPKVTWVCRKILRPGDVMLDVGAHCGVVALEAARLVGPQGMVHAFEPQPRLAAMLRKSAKLNGLASLHIHEVALGDTDGQAELHLPGGKQILASLLADASGGDSIAVEVRRASSFLPSLHAGPVRLLKLDVEGFEYTLLRSTASYLEDAKVDYIVLESVEAEGPFWDRSPIALLKDMGYGFMALPKRLFGCRAEPVSPGALPPAGCHDFVAVREMDAAVGILK